MLWKPATYGEEAFLTAYESLGRHLALTARHPMSLDFLFSEESFQEFARLHATIELFIRCIRAASFIYAQFCHLPAPEFGKQLSRSGYLSRRLSDDRRFCELIKQSARISIEQKSASPALAKEIREARRACYMCGIQLKRSGAGRDRATIEHLWPLSLGGESIEHNLIAACQDCNEKRDNSITWAWGPVQSTDYRHKQDQSPNVGLRISLAVAKLMLEASGERTGRMSTLKEAALQQSPLFPNLDIKDDRHRVYFELFDQVRRAA
jgi:HNH endonuclease